MDREREPEAPGRLYEEMKEDLEALVTYPPCPLNALSENSVP